MKRKFELKLWAAFLVTFFALLGIKIKKSRAKKALKFAEKFFKKQDKKNRKSRERRFSKKVPWRMREYRQILKGTTGKANIMLKKKLMFDKHFRKQCWVAIRHNDRKEMGRLRAGVLQEYRARVKAARRMSKAAPMKTAA